jgi:hypothetical protein
MIQLFSKKKKDKPIHEHDKRILVDLSLLLREFILALNCSLTNQNKRSRYFTQNYASTLYLTRFITWSRDVIDILHIR